MKIGVPKEIKTNENRIALVPAGAEVLVAAGHSVAIEAGGGLGSGFADADYAAVGASVAPDAATVWRDSEMIMKVKEPIEREWRHMRRGQLIFTYFHFAADEKLTRAHIASGATCVAYETVELPSHELPLLIPMSEVAGRMAVQEGAKYLEKLYGGRGVLLGGVPGVAPAKVVILGGGIVGINAAKMAAGMGAKVTILDLSLERLRSNSPRSTFAACSRARRRRAPPSAASRSAGAHLSGCNCAWRSATAASTTTAIRRTCATRATPRRSCCASWRSGRSPRARS